MAQLLVCDPDDQVMARLKERARRNQRSLEAEARAILAAAAQRYTKEEALDVFRAWHARIGARSMSDSTDLIREDRDR
jgi:plasmid stability protein